MKFKSTRKALMDGYKCYKVGYCALSHLFWSKNPIAYTCGVYGWNADVYDIGDNIAIVTGYRPFGKSVDYGTCKKYDDKAKEILASDESYEHKRNALSWLIFDFAKELTK